MFKAFILSMLITVEAQAVIGNVVLVQVANNTLASVRELKDILTGQREFTKEFERVHAQVNTRIWQAERAQMWAEDLNSLNSSELNNIDDFNLVLRSIKNSKKQLQRLLVEIFNRSQQQKQDERRAKSQYKKIDNRLKVYAGSTTGSLNTTNAQIQTAQNTHDILMEQTRTNKQLVRLIEKQSTLLAHYQEGEQRRVAKELRTKRSLGQLDHGVLKQEDFE